MDTEGGYQSDSVGLKVGVQKMEALDKSKGMMWMSEGGYHTLQPPCDRIQVGIPVDHRSE